MSQALPELLSLPTRHKSQLIEELWDGIDTPDQPPLPDWMKEELDRRDAEFQHNPPAGSSWEEVKERIRKGRP